MWKRMFSFALPQIYYFKKRVLIKIFCASILRQINKTIHNLSHQIFFLTCLCSCGLLIGLYSFCSLAYLCKGLQLFYFFLSVPFLYSQLFYFLFSCVCSGEFYVIAYFATRKTKYPKAGGGGGVPQGEPSDPLKKYGL